MKKLIIAFALISILLSCKKETTNTNFTTNTSNGVTCGDNPNINFTSIGTPIGKFADCIKDVDGNVYKTVTIGTQTWMAENLKTSKYNDGTQIPNITDNTQWQKDTITLGPFLYYNKDSLYNSKYGKLYNWYSVSTITNGNKNLCPTGWHVPTNTEWIILTDYLGGGSIAGSKMKEVGTASWNSLNSNATNTSMFSGLPGGYVDFNVENDSIGSLGYWWSSTEVSVYNAWCRNLSNKYSNAFSSLSSKSIGFSIRCLKD